MELRIDELALHTGTTSRNIRAYQARGLLPAPTLRGRTGYYGEEHVRRLELIRDLKERGFSLEGMRHLFDVWSQGGDIGQLLGIHQLISSPWQAGETVTVSREELSELYPEVRERPELINQAMALGLLTEEGDGRFTGDRMVIEAGAELVRVGLTQDEIFQLVQLIRANTDAIATHFVAAVSRQLMAPVLDGSELADPGAIVGTVLRLRGIALDVVRPFLAEALTTATEAAIDDFRSQLAERVPESAGDAAGA